MQKKNILAIEVFVVLIGIVCIVSYITLQGENSLSMQAQSYMDKAEELLETVDRLYKESDEEMYREFYPEYANSREASTLWPVSEIISATNTILDMDYKTKYYNQYFQEELSMLEQFFDTVRLPHAYESYPTQLGGGDRFYDDNMWIGYDLALAYKRTKNEKYLERANEIFEFIQSGWDEQLDGGIYWCEQNRQTKNTCSNGPAAVMLLDLYQSTKNEEYLAWGEKIYTWTRNNLRAPEGLYWDNINVEDGHINEAKYAYNTGTMLHASVMLYEITQDESYLEEAETLANMSYEHFAPIENTYEGIRFFPERDPWFTAVLFRGYEALYEITQDSTYVDGIIENIDYAWEHARDENGLIEQDWRGLTVTDSKRILDQLAMVEMYARAAKIINAK